MGCLLTSELLKYMNKENIGDRIIVSPILNKRQIGRDSIDIRLSGDLFLPIKIETNYLDPLISIKKFNKNSEKIRNYFKLDFGESFTIHPGEFIIGSSFEYIGLPKNIMALLHGRSSWARSGLIVHATAGVIHPGYQGVLTYELSNLGPIPIKLYPLMRIGQIVFYEGLGKIDETIKKSQFYLSSLSKIPNPIFDYDYPILRDIKEKKKKQNVFEKK